MFERRKRAVRFVGVTSRDPRVNRRCVASLHAGVMMSLLSGSLTGCEVGEGSASGVAKEPVVESDHFASPDTSDAVEEYGCEEPKDEPLQLDGPTKPSEFSGSDCVDAEIGELANLPRISGVTIDGDASEWAGIDPAAFGSPGREEKMKLAVDCDHLYVLVEGAELAERTQLLLDTDGDAATGEPLGLKDEWAASGADYLFAKDWFASHVTVDFSWTGQPGIAEARRGGNSVMEYRIPFKKLGGLIQPRAGLVFRNMRLLSGGAEEVISQIPERGIWRIPPKYENRGMIVPAYFPPNQDEPWIALNQAAKAMGGAHDFWVAISGTSSGPHELTPERLERWHAAQESGAELFAYVGTCKHNPRPDDAGVATVHGCDGLRPHCAVMGDVVAWRNAVRDWNEQLSKRPTKNGKPREPLKLTGIWIDEFYPNQEVMARGEAVVVDRSKQIVTTNGYYHKLTTAIRRLDPDWKLIGNAGGRLESNQLNYAKLVDVVCSFEAKLGHTDPWQEGKEKGPGLQIQLVHPSYGQLALVHENTSETGMNELIQRVFEEGYSHVYTTDVPHSKPDGGVNELWNIAPSYLVKQAQAVRAGLAAGDWKPRVSKPSSQ